MPRILEDMNRIQAEKEIKDQAKAMVEDFQWIIITLAKAIYCLPYWELPAQSKRAIRSAAREVITDRIWELTEPKCP
jgi:hypothetical protein